MHTEDTVFVCFVGMAAVASKCRWRWRDILLHLNGKASKTPSNFLRKAQKQWPYFVSMDAVFVISGRLFPHGKSHFHFRDCQVQTVVKSLSICSQATYPDANCIRETVSLSLSFIASNIKAHIVHLPFCWNSTGTLWRYRQKNRVPKICRVFWTFPTPFILNLILCRKKNVCSLQINFFEKMVFFSKIKWNRDLSKKDKPQNDSIHMGKLNFHSTTNSNSANA